jgi:Cytochrome P450
MAMRTEPLVNTPLSPSAPEDVYFSDGQNAWILSRHQDVLAALKSVHLDQAGPPKSSSNRARPIRNKESSEAAKALFNTSLARWEGARAALLLHRSAWNALRARSESVFVAVEELLRYAGPVHSLFRTALKNTTISATAIAAGDRLILRPAAANRDPRRFEQPGHLDIERRATGHLALSAGSHYCIGASLVRSMTATATQALLARCEEPKLSDPIQWSCGTMLIWASSLQVILDRASV